MGLQEFLKKSWYAITGRDPEGQEGLYRYHNEDIGLPTNGDVHHKSTASSPVQTPPGVIYYKDANGKLAWKWVHNTNGYQQAYITTSSGTEYLDTTLARGPFTNPWYANTEGAAVGNASSSYWRVDDVTINVNTADTALVTKHATLATEIAVISLQANCANQATAQDVILEFQDEDDAAVEGCDTIRLQVLCDETNNAYGGNNFAYYGGLVRAKTAAANKTLEVDVNNFGAAGGTVHLTYMWRYVPA